MLQHFALLASALPAITFAAIADDAAYRGVSTALALGKEGAAACDSSIGTTYAAINTDQWNATQNCNKCVAVSCSDDRCSDKTKSVVVHVTSECERCEDEGLDLSPEVFLELTGSAPASYSVEWEFTTCPADEKAYEAGQVEPAEEEEANVSILQDNEEKVETEKEDTETGSGAGGTSPLVIVLIAAGAVCALALVGVMYKAKMNRTKRDDFVTKSFDTFSSPTQKKKKAAIVKI